MASRIVESKVSGEVAKAFERLGAVGPPSEARISRDIRHSTSNVDGSCRSGDLAACRNVVIKAGSDTRPS